MTFLTHFKSKLYRALLFILLGSNNDGRPHPQHGLFKVEFIPANVCKIPELSKNGRSQEERKINHIISRNSFGLKSNLFLFTLSSSFPTVLVLDLTLPIHQHPGCAAG